MREGKERGRWGEMLERGRLNEKEKEMLVTSLAARGPINKNGLSFVC